MTHIKQRGDTAANWAYHNPVLMVREVGWETDTRKSKLGDGVTPWNSLPYTTVDIPVRSVNTQTGDVVLTKTDLGLGNVNNTSDVNKPVSTAQADAINASAAATLAAASAMIGAAGTPVGVVAMWPVNAPPPTNWLLCTGGTFNAATYPQLQAVLGGNTLPNYQLRFPVGAGAGRAVGSTGGSASVTLSEANLPAHSHTMEHTHTMAHTHTINHSHDIMTTNDSGSGGTVVRGQAASGGTNRSGPIQTHSGNSGASSAANTGAASASSTGSVGSGTPVNTEPPWVAINFIIKAA